MLLQAIKAVMTMALDAFIKIEGIPGDSLDEQHKDWIEVSGYSFGAKQSISSTASSAGGGRQPVEQTLQSSRSPNDWTGPAANSSKPVARAII
jgi:hypothetical protein